MFTDATLKLPALLKPELGLKKMHRERILYELDQLPLVTSLPGPKFVFAHIGAPQRHIMVQLRKAEPEPNRVPCGRAGALTKSSETSTKEADPEAAREAEIKAASPKRFLALYFDDIRMPFEDVALVRKAAQIYLATSLTPGDRVGIYTSSGLGDLDFTAQDIRVERAVSAGGEVSTPKSGHGRTVDMATSVRDVLQRHAFLLNVEHELVRERELCAYRGRKAVSHCAKAA